MKERETWVEEHREREERRKERIYIEKGKFLNQIYKKFEATKQEVEEKFK